MSAQKKILSSLGWLWPYPLCNAGGCVSVLHWISCACLKCISQLLLLSKLLFVLGIILQTWIRFLWLQTVRKSVFQECLEQVAAIAEVASCSHSVCAQARAIASVRECPALLSLAFGGSVGGRSLIMPVLHAGWLWLSFLFADVDPATIRNILVLQLLRNLRGEKKKTPKVFR